MNLRSERGQAGDGAITFVLVAVGIVLILGALIGLVFGFKAVSRYQSRADRNQNRTQARYDANNEVLVNAIRIRTQEQKVKIAQQDAQIRYVKSIGIKRAQDEISKTLTPLYVQFEYIDALRSIAASGRNATVVYIPVGPNGIPIVKANPTGP